MDNSPYLNTEECGDYLKRSPGAIRNLVMRRKIPFRKPGGRLMFLKAEIDDWIENSPGLKVGELDEADHNYV
ncbi:helix-turn-helix domain-containing protein [Thermodesulfobacteriota bacterium]